MSRVPESEGRASTSGRSFAATYHSKVEVGYDIYCLYHRVAYVVTRHDCIMVTVDKLSKVAHFSPMRASYIASSIAHVFLEDVVCLHEIPHQIISYGDLLFTFSLCISL